MSIDSPPHDATLDGLPKKNTQRAIAMTYWLDLFTGTTWDEFRGRRSCSNGR